MLRKLGTILESEAGAEGASGGAPTGALLSKGDPSPGAGTAPPVESAKVEVPEWKKSLPEDLQGAASLKMIHDVETLAKSYVNAQKLVGSDKIPVPSKHATNEEWRDVYKKLGLPETIDDYKMDIAPEILEQANPEVMKNLTATAHELNILPHQLKGLVEFYHKAELGAQEAFNKGLETENAQAMDKLKKEWGVAFEAKANIASNVLRENATEEDWAYLENAGLTKSPELARVMAKIGEKLYGEAQIKTGAQKNGGRLSPEEALMEIESLQKDTAYSEAGHPNHQKAVAEMQRLFQMAYPSDNA